MSSGPTLRGEQLARTRTTILAAARARFGRDGFAGASLDEIARDAGATTGALYHHFAGKRALFTAVAEALEADVLHCLVAAADEMEPTTNTLLVLLRRSLDLVGEPETARILLVDAPGVVGYEAWRAIEMRYGLGATTQLLAALVDAGTIRAVPPPLTARLLLAMLIEGAHAAAAAPDPDAMRAAAFGLIQAFVESLRPAKQGA